MKILIVRSYPSYMEVENRTYNVQELGLAKALIRKGCQCDILFWTAEEEKEVRIPVGDNFVTVYYRKAVSILKNAIYTGCKDLYETYDIIQTAEYNQFQSLWMALKYPKKHVVYHGPYYCAFNRNYNRFCALFDIFFLWIYKWKKTRFITKSKLACEYLVQKGIKAEYVRMVGVGIDEESLGVYGSITSDIAHKDAFLSRMKRDENKKLLYIGKIEPRRNIFFLLQILEELVKRKLPVRLYIIGDGEATYVSRVKSYIEEHKLGDHIVWEEKMEQRYLSEVYKASDLFLLPTIYEIFGMVLLEAMYFGIPVLTTQNGGSDTLIRDGENGYILRTDDVDGWVDIIEKYCHAQQDFFGMKEKATDTIQNMFTWDCLAEQFLEVYRSLDGTQPFSDKSRESK